MLNIDKKLAETFVALLSLATLKENFFPTPNLYDIISKRLNFERNNHDVIDVINRLKEDGFIIMCDDIENNTQFFSLTLNGEDELEKLKSDVYSFYLLCKPLLSDDNKMYEIE